MSLLWLLSSATLLLRISLQYQACPNVRGSEMKSRIWTFSLMNTVILINTSVKFHLLTSINLNFQTASLNALLVGERADIGSVSPPQITHIYKVSSVHFSSLEGTFHKRFVVHKEVLLPICSVLELVFINRLSIMGQSWRTNGNICSCMSVISTSSKIGLPVLSGFLVPMYISCLKREEIWMSDPHVFVPHKNIRVLFTLGIGFFFKYWEAKLNFQLCFKAVANYEFKLWNVFFYQTCCYKNSARIASALHINPVSRVSNGYAEV